MKLACARMRGFGHRLLDVLGMYRMSERFHVLALNYLFLIFYTTLESVFVNTLLFRAFDGDMRAVILYRGITYVASGIGMNLSALLAQKKTPVLATRLGAVFYFGMYLLLFVGLDHMRFFLYPVAVCSGLGMCFYYNGHYILLPHYTEPRNRDVGVSILGIIQGMMTLLVPVISGFVISLMPETTGYRVMFGVGMLAVGAQIWFSRGLQPIQQKKHKSELRLALKLVAKKSSYKMALGAEFFRGFRDGTFAFLLNMLLFQLITDEGVIGLNTFLTGVLSIAGSWAYGRLATGKNRVRWCLITLSTLMVVSAGLYLGMSASVLIVFTACNSFLQVFLTYSYSSTMFDLISFNQVARSCSAEMLAMRELSAMVGRVLGLALTWSVASGGGSSRDYVGVMLLLTASQYAGVFLMKGVSTRMERRRKQEKEANGAKAGKAGAG